MDTLRPETLAAVEAARIGLDRAGAGTGTVHAKAGRPRDVVTDADVAVEDAVRESLAGATGLPVVGEERGGTPPASGAYFLVDPICGTRNFASRIPLYAVNLALVEDGRITAAAVGDATTGTVHLAERGRGCFALVEPEPSRCAVSLDSRVVAVGGFPPAGGARDRAARFLARLVAEDRFDVRSFGTSLGLLFLATGRIAAEVFFSITALHLGAGALLAEEAGAVVSDAGGDPWTIESTSLVASATAALHDELLAGLGAVDAAR